MNNPSNTPEIDKIDVQLADDQIYFAVTVSRQRAEYLARCLDEPLCNGCGREEAECSADPCPGVIADREE